MPEPWDPYDRDLAIRTIIGESAGGTPEEQQAVGNIIMNRLSTGRWGNRPRDVVLAQGQFEPWATRRRELLGYAPEDPAYIAAGQALDRAAAGDITGGMTHFYSPVAQRELGREPPSWSVGQQPRVIGRHNLYAPEGPVQMAQAGIDWGAEVMGAPASPSRQSPLSAPAAAAAPAPTSRPMPVGGGIDWAVETGARPPPPPGPGVNTTIRPPGVEPPAQPGVDPLNYFPPKPAGPTWGEAGTYADNLARQAAQGMSFGGVDELDAYLGALKAYFTDEEYGALRARILAEGRARDAAFAKENPVAATTAQIGGALATAPMLPGAAAMRGAGVGGRAVVGGAQGGGAGLVSGFLSGEGGVENRLDRAAEEGAFGAAAGQLGPYLGRAATGAADLVRAPFRGAIGVDREAVRRLGTRGFGPDATDMDSARRTLEMARQNDIPFTVADTGGENTRALLRSATNTSPEARQQISDITSQRFWAQSERVNRFINAITGRRVDTEQAGEILQQAARAANAPAYRRAYAAGQDLWTPELQQLTQSPNFRSAMQKAESIGQDIAAMEGFPPIPQPFTFSRDGAQLTPGMMPNLQFWDYVHRALQGAEGVARRAGDDDTARRVGNLNRQLTDHLDTLVPEFAQARGGAARAFGYRDALEYGQDVLTNNRETGAIARELRAFSPEELALVRHAALNDLVERVSKVGDTGDVVTRIFRSDKARRRLEMVIGAQQAGRIQHLVAIENLMNRTRAALGNSTTARQLFEGGMAGGVIGGWQGGDMTSFSTGAALGGLLRRGTATIDSRVARRVGEMLASDDPAVLQRVADMMARNRQIREAVHGATRMLTARSGMLAPEREE